MRKSLFRASGTLLIALLGVGVALAQEVVVKRRSAVSGEGAPATSHLRMRTMAPQTGTYTFVATQAGMEGKVVKGKPYSAEGVTTHKQVLIDGTTITKESTSKIYRDSQGRTRREMTLAAIGPWAAEGEPPTTVTINDPVAGRIFVSQKGSHTAKAIDVVTDGPGEREVVIVKKSVEAGESSHEATVETSHEANGVWIHTEETGPGSVQRREHDFTMAGPPLGPGDGETTTQELGEKVIEGVVARGKMKTTVIPKGKIGNDAPITITTETWYSDEIEAMVLTESNNPLVGQVTYRLQNVSRAEPDPTLFDAPEDVEIEEGHSIHRRIRVERKTKD